MLYHLSNQYLSVQISSLGAELKSVKSISHNIEYMWQADPEFWGRTSPILFPIVGRLTDNSTLIHHQAMKFHSMALSVIWRLAALSKVNHIWYF